MAKSTLYNLNIDSPEDISDELYSSVGSDEFVLGDIKRGFYDLTIRTASGGGGTLLVLDTDYTLPSNDSDYSAIAEFTIYIGVKVINAAYQACDLYATYKCIGSYTDVASIQQLIDNAQALDRYSVTANYTILDDDGYDIIEVDSRTGNVAISLPTVADNEERIIRFKVVYAGGLVTIDGEGAETIDGDSSIYLNGKDDQLIVYGSSSEWKILSLRQTCDTGWINRSDWTNVHMGMMEVDYDNLVGAFTVGESVAFDSGVTGIIMADTGSTLTLKMMTGVGYGVDGEQITGDTSGATADVNEGGGSSKNLDANITHDFGKNIRQLRIKFLVSTDGTENNSFEIPNTSYDLAAAANQTCGITTYQVGTNSFKLQSGSTAIIYALDNGTLGALDTEDYYYRIIAERII